MTGRPDDGSDAALDPALAVRGRLHPQRSVTTAPVVESWLALTSGAEGALFPPERTGSRFLLAVVDRVSPSRDDRPRPHDSLSMLRLFSWRWARCSTRSDRRARQSFIGPGPVRDRQLSDWTPAWGVHDIHPDEDFLGRRPDRPCREESPGGSLGMCACCVRQRPTTATSGRCCRSREPWQRRDTRSGWLLPRRTQARWRRQVSHTNRSPMRPAS